MNLWLPTGVMFGGVVFFLAMGLPVAFALGSGAMITALIFIGPQALALSAVDTYGLMRNLGLVAMPLFMFMAAVLEKSGIAESLYASLHQWLGPLKGGLAISTVAICTVIAAMSGIQAAGIVTMGLIALPIMLNKGYNKSIAIGPILAGGALGLLIPPSCDFIIYGMMTKTSIGKLFAGGLIPGLILSFLYMTYIGIMCYFKPHLGPALAKEERVSLKKKIILSRGLILPTLLIILVLGSIFGGIASPTEAAAVGAGGAVVCTALNRRFKLQMIKESLYRTVIFNSMCMWILFGAFCFSSIFISTGAPQLIKELILSLEVPPILIIFFMMLTYFILGCFIDEITMLMLTLPIYLPIILGLGYDPVWFGILFLVNVQMACLTPPFGFAIFIFRGVAPPEVTLIDIYRSVIPFVGLQWIVLLLVLFFPQLALWLPNVIFGLK